MIIDELHKLRREVCTCRKLFVTPAFHEPDCPYIDAGNKAFSDHAAEYLQPEGKDEKDGTDHAD